MSDYIDITGVLSPEMWSYSGLIGDLPPFEQRRWATIESHGFEADWFAMPTLAGTYLETAKHLVSGFQSIEQVPPEKFFPRAVVALIPKGPREHIGVEDLQGAVGELLPGDALIVRTGWSQHWWDTSGMFVADSPHFDLAGMKWICNHGISILGGDMPCFDDPQPDQGMGVNDVLFGIGAMILAPLCNLPESGPATWRLNVMPIPLQDSCGAPCRAVLSPL